MANRRGHGEGNIRQRPDGRWEARIDLGWMDGGRRRRSVHGRTRGEVAAKLRKAQTQVDSGLPLGDKRLTVADVLERWLTLQQTAGKAPNTLSNYEWAVRGHLIPALGQIRLAELSADHIDAMLANRSKAGAAQSSLVRLRSILAMALKFAVRRDLVARNVALLTDPPRGPKKPGRSLTAEQAAAFLEAAKDDAFEAVYITQLMLGLRPGEVLGLMWRDVDFDAGRVRIRQAIQVENGSRAVVGPLKTASSRRTLALPSPVIEALQAQRRRQREARIHAGPAWVDSGFVFTTSLGTPVHPRNYRRSLTRVTQKAGLGHWHPHELRHSAVSLLSAAGLRLEDIADIVGHASIRMTAEVYRHHVQPTITAGKAAMDELFGNEAEKFGGQIGGQGQLFGS